MHTSLMLVILVHMADLLPSLGGLNLSITQCNNMEVAGLSKMLADGLTIVGWICNFYHRFSHSLAKAKV
jgi:hypothetical protein